MAPELNDGDKVIVTFPGTVRWAELGYAEVHREHEGSVYTAGFAIDDEGVTVVPANRPDRFELMLMRLADRVAEADAAAKRCLSPDEDLPTLAREHHVQAQALHEFLVSVLVAEAGDDAAAVQAAQMVGDRLIVEAASRRAAEVSQ